MKNILVTGSDGFVGQNMMKKLPGAKAFDRSTHDFFKLETLQSALADVDIYGPHAKPFYNSAVATMCHLALEGKTLDLYGNGQVELDLLYVDDAIEYTRRALEMTDLHCVEIFNLATGRTVTVGEIADHIKQVLKKPVERQLKNIPVKPCAIDTQHLQTRLGKIEWKPLQQGLKVQIEAALAHRRLANDSFPIRQTDA